MWLKNLQIQYFRNYKLTEIDFHPGLNIFLGENAQGKTNILEAIYFLALTRSHRTRSDKDLIYFSNDSLKISGQLAKETGNISLEIDLTPKGRTTKVNHLKQSKLSDYVGNMNVVLFAPADLQLIKGTPALRRKFIDIELGQIKPIYLSDLSQYHHVLKQRNAYLKAAKKIDETFLTVLDDQLVEFGCRVMQHRIKYCSSIPLSDPNKLKESFQIALRQSRSRDLFKKNTGIGPHRDDIAFYINNMNATFGSQGQHRSMVLSLKLAEIELMETVTKEKPILLLDDVMSELDNNRQLNLLETISQNIQTFITTTTLEHLKHLPSDIKIFSIHDGHFMENQV